MRIESASLYCLWSLVEGFSEPIAPDMKMALEDLRLLGILHHALEDPTVSV